MIEKVRILYSSETKPIAKTMSIEEFVRLGYKNKRILSVDPIYSDKENQRNIKPPVSKLWEKDNNPIPRIKGFTPSDELNRVMELAGEEFKKLLCGNTEEKQEDEIKGILYQVDQNGETDYYSVGSTFMDATRIVAFNQQTSKDDYILMYGVYVKNKLSACINAKHVVRVDYKTPIDI